MTRPCPRLVVAALRGGCGKTTLSLSLISAWRRQGRRIVPFKKGPDYIDAGWLAQAAGYPCFNLDPFMMNRDVVRRSFVYRAAQGLDGAVIEGNRGLFDGTDAAGTYSTAELAKLLDAPVVMILDCTKVTRTLAAVVLGCQHFDPDVRLAGVILNQVATGRQEKLVRSAIEDATGLPVLGATPRVRNQDMPERHLGLVPHQEHPRAHRVLEGLADLACAHLDLDRLWAIAASAPTLSDPPDDLWGASFPATRLVKIGVIRDSVFQFYYPENLEALERLGARIVDFSSLDASSLPDVDALYLGGGFPETHAEILSRNDGLRTSIRKAAESGLPIYAECGGLMYLGDALLLQDRVYPMAGVFPVKFGLERRPQGHGYTVVEPVTTNPYFPVGQELIGHEFHYSRPIDYDPEALNLVFSVKRGFGFDGQRDGLVMNNVLGTYTHLHALGTVRWAEALVEQAVRYRTRRQEGGPEVTR